MRIILKNFVNTLLHYKVSSILNVVGLALAFASMYILLVQVNWELTYNHSIQDADRVFVLETTDGDEGGKYSQYLYRPLAEKLKASAPYIEAIGTEGGEPHDMTVRVKREGGDMEHITCKYASVSTSFTDVVGFESIEGDIHHFTKPNTVAIPQTMAANFSLKLGDMLYYGEDTGETKFFEIVAIYKDFADNTFLAHNPIITDMREHCLTDYSLWNFIYYVKLKTISDKDKFEALFLEKHKEWYINEGATKEELDAVHVRLVPIKDIYFGERVWSDEIRGDKNTVYLFLAVVSIIVVIALINFINFFYALIPVRIKKVNTLKIFGSPLYALRLNFVVEALGLVLIALLIAWYIVYMVQLSSMSEYISTSLSLTNNPLVLTITLVSAFMLAVVVSIYPAYYITSFPMSFAIKGSFGASMRGKRLRTMLLGVQFIISITLITAAIFVRVQNHYMVKHDMGFNKENVLSVYATDSIVGRYQQAYTEKLLSNPQIKDVTWVFRDFMTNQKDTRLGWSREFKNGEIDFTCLPVSYDFLAFMGIKITEGRDFREDDNLKIKGTLIFNEYAKKKFGLTLGDKILATNSPTEIVGFCENFNFLSLQNAMSPLALFVDHFEGAYQPDHIYLRTEANADMKAVIDYIKTTMVEFDPTISKEEVDVVFFDEELGRLYYKEEKLTTLITLFSIVSIVISLMGVFGLVLFETQYRRKEIGIRRVHGASRREILAMFNRKYITLVLVCFVIAVPISYYLLHQWVSRFAYRAPMAWWIFALALLLVLLITIATVTTRSMKAANEDPANSIKTE